MIETSLFKKDNPISRWVWQALVLLAMAAVWLRYDAQLDGYEKAVLVITALGIAALGRDWIGFRWHIVLVGALSGVAAYLYGVDLTLGNSNFFLKYLLSSQSAISWMSALFVLAMIAYFWGLFLNFDFSQRVGSFLTWAATTLGLIGLMVRWRESHLLGADIGHIPVSNLYEVFILFSIVTALIYLYYERHYRTRALGGFVLLVVSAAVLFQLWYSVVRGADMIQPLVPALQSYWMKIHVPANFIGYGAFALAAMIGVTYLLASRKGAEKGGWIARLPALSIMDDVMYKSIALGFAFFTLATVLGALWAAEAWGGYWSWDPKETWALIVWLNYAAWLHMRMSKGWHGRPMAWWAVVGLFVTLFAFLGVNMFLSGLHSYGTL